MFDFSESNFESASNPKRYELNVITLEVKWKSDPNTFSYGVTEQSDGVFKFLYDKAVAGDFGEVQDLFEPVDYFSQLKSYRDLKAQKFDYKGIIMNLHDGARADLTALYFSVVLNPAIPDETVMAKWQENGYPTLDITAGDLRNDGQSIMQHRQNVWTAYDAVKDQTFRSVEELEAAFDAEMGA